MYSVKVQIIFGNLSSNDTNKVEENFIRDFVMILFEFGAFLSKFLRMNSVQTVSASLAWMVLTMSSVSSSDSSGKCSSRNVVAALCRLSMFRIPPIAISSFTTSMSLLRSTGSSS